MTEPQPQYDATAESRPMPYRHRAVLRYIIDYKTEHGGDSPTVREIMKAVKIPSSSAVTYCLRRLQEHGLIARLPGGPRSSRIQVTGGRWVYEPPNEATP